MTRKSDDDDLVILALYEWINDTTGEQSLYILPADYIAVSKNTL